MPPDFCWRQAITLGIAVLGAVLGVFNAWMTLRRDRVRLKIAGHVQQGEDGISRLRIKLVNTGRVSVTVEKVGLRRWGVHQPKMWELWEHGAGKPQLPKLLQPGERLLLVIHRDAIDRPLVDQCFTVVAQTAQGGLIKGRGAGLRELAAQAKAAAGKAAGEAAP